LIPALYFGLGGLAELGLKISETHRPEKVVTSGIYSRVRHPQYLGGLFGHISMTFLFSGLYSLYVTPLVIAEVYFIAQKEEKELIKEFGADYKKYQEKVPMFLVRM
jgi:protein-S-isoprenylcysteine O-methyltransferase Ste14